MCLTSLPLDFLSRTFAMDTQMSKLEEAMEEVLGIFKQECTRSKTMMKNDLKRTLRAELVNWLQVQLILFVYPP